MNNPAVVEQISESFIKPKHEVEESKLAYYLGPWDLPMLSGNYIQKGLLFAKPNPDHSKYSITKLVETLKDSLSLTLVRFYPLAGQLATRVDEDCHESLVFIDPTKGPGARFIHANLHMTISNILSPTDVPPVVRTLFDHDGAVNHDGHTRPLLSVQVTELLDGVFIGVSFNHLVGDGTSYWHFWTTWSQLHMHGVTMMDPPIHQRWFPEGYGPELPLPFIRPGEVISRHQGPPLRERFFHFTADSISRLKAKANEETNHTHKISSFQALSALVWRSIVRANHVPHDQPTHCILATNNRHRLQPPLPSNYFGNSVYVTFANTTVGELLEKSLGSATLMLNQAVENYTDDTVREFVKGWVNSRSIYNLETVVSPSNVFMGSSPRFDMYGSEFGLGKAVAVRSGSANKFAGKVSSYPGREGGGSVDLEVCLPPDSMTALESDEGFMAAVSSLA